MSTINHSSGARCNTCLLPSYRCECPDGTHHDIKFSPFAMIESLNVPAEFDSRELILIRILAASAMMAPTTPSNSATVYERIIAIASKQLAAKEPTTLINGGV